MRTEKEINEAVAKVRLATVIMAFDTTTLTIGEFYDRVLVCLSWVGGEENSFGFFLESLEKNFKDMGGTELWGRSYREVAKELLKRERAKYEPMQ